MSKKRRFSTFSVSFLDIMSCGLGAVILVFLIIKHESNVQIEETNRDLTSEVNQLEEEVREGREHLAVIHNTIAKLDQELVDTDGLARRITQDITVVESKIQQLDDLGIEQLLIQLKNELTLLQQQKKKLDAEQEHGDRVRAYVGEGDRQYLTGLKLGGRRVLILLDASASMLDDSIVNILRRRNMTADEKRVSKKWVRALDTVEWLMAQLPPQSQYQLYTFNTELKAALSYTEQKWLEVSDQAQVDQILINIRKQVPEKGTSLVRAFNAIAQFNPMPDNIFLITDGLPTQGLSQPQGYTVTGPERLELFYDAVESIPTGIPVNVLLWPMEGDPSAASAFWKLAQATSGSFLSPSVDWP